MPEDLCFYLLHPYKIATLLETVIILLQHHCLLLGLFVHDEVQPQTAELHIGKLLEAFCLFYLLPSLGGEVVVLLLQHAAAVVVIDALAPGTLV